LWYNVFTLTTTGFIMSSSIMYTLYDSKAEFYSAPFFAPNETVATRDFHKLIHVTGAIAPAYAGDFTLFEVGSFSPDSGLFEALPNPRQVVAGSFLKDHTYE
jgi:hypothetical protein